MDTQKVLSLQNMLPTRKDNTQYKNYTIDNYKKA